MANALKQEWSKPRTILFATEIPSNERAFSYALAQAREFDAALIPFHVYDSLVVAASETSGARYHDYAVAARSEMHHLEPMAERARAAGVRCEVVVRPGLPADQILTYVRESDIDRVVMGTHSPGPVGKLLVGSVAEAVVRTATVPVFVVGPHVPEHMPAGHTRTVLCACSLLDTTAVVAGFAAFVAAQHRARLVLQHVIKPQERHEVLAGHTIDEIENQLINLVPYELHEKIEVQAVVVPGDPTEELLYQSRSQQADLIVLGAQGASAFAAITRHGVVYKLLAQAHCPVLTLSPAVLSQAGATGEKVSQLETFIAGTF